MQEEKIVTAIESLKDSIDALKESVDKLHAIQTDILNSDNHDMLRELNGSIQELIKEFENKR